jgi:hypothetical protein
MTKYIKDLQKNDTVVWQGQPYTVQRVHFSNIPGRVEVRFETRDKFTYYTEYHYLDKVEVQ